MRLSKINGSRQKSFGSLFHSWQGKATKILELLDTCENHHSLILYESFGLKSHTWLD